jgi:tRNA(Arg) A34 adenosine deaminase TadA
VIVMHLENNGGSVVVSHGANQVNCTRDATRHAEIVAIDRMLTGGKSSDLLRLPADAIANSAHTGNVPESSALFSEERRELLFKDKWLNVPEDPSHWKNGYGWGSGRIYSGKVFSKCDLYVTCEPCIMVSSESVEAIATVSKEHLELLLFFLRKN